MRRASRYLRIAAIVCIAILFVVGFFERRPARIDGTWKKVDEVHEITRLTQTPPHLIMTIRGNNVTKTIGSRLVGKGSVKLGTNQRSKTIDFNVNIVGTSTTWIANGIYDVKGDTLRICTSKDGHRPKDLDFLMKGSGETLETFERVE
jgi:uncharacterized protein (TIGR03067 family)